MDTTEIFRKTLEGYNDGCKLIINEGGTSSSKTISILQCLLVIAQVSAEPLIISVVSETLPHLKRGCIRDFKFILGDMFNERDYNKSEQLYRFGNCTFEFFPADDASKMRGGRRDILFINEANNVSHDAYRELEMRTRGCVFLDWNPVSEFWAHSAGLLTESGTRYIHSTYLDALHLLPAKVIERIESYRGRDPNWWHVYGLGLLGQVEGLVYPYFEQCEDMPDGDRFFGLDFGYSNDPASVVEIIINGEGMHCREHVYETGLTNSDLSERMERAGIRKRYDEIFADSAEPKSIEELYRMGWNIKPCPKGADSVEYGHQRVRQYKQHWTSDSLNCIKEQRNFRYVADKDGKLTQKTTHMWSHGMDARRYGLVGKLLEEKNIVTVYDTVEQYGSIVPDLDRWDW